MINRQRPAARHVSRLAVLAVMAAATGAVLTRADAQETEYLQEKRDDSLRRKKYLVDRILNGQEDFAENRQTVSDYFNKYFFPNMTYAAVEMPKVSQQGLYKSTADLRRNFTSQLRRSNNPQAAEFVNQLALEKLKAYATQNYHPTVRVNAVLLIGDLDADPGTSAMNRQPQPLPASLPVLIEFLKNEQMTDATKVAALVGIHRHAAAGLPEGARSGITELMLQIVSGAEVPSERSGEGDNWMRQQAAEILGLLGSVGEQGRVLQALTDTLKERDAPLWLRCAAAASLAQLQFEGSATDTSPIVMSLGRYAGDAIKDAVAMARAAQVEAQRAQTKTSFGRRREDPSAVTRPGGNLSEQPVQPVIFPRATLAYRTLCARKALEAIQEAANAQAQEQARQLLDLLQSIYEMMEVDLEYPQQEVDIDRVSLLGEQIDDIFAKTGGEAAEAGAADEEQAERLEAAQDGGERLSEVFGNMTAG